MFAIFFTPQMDRFYQIVTSFPTVIFSAVLIFCVFYWVLAVLGLVEIDVLDFDIPDLEGDGVGFENDALSNLNVMSGLLLKLGLNGVPIAIVISLISLMGWVMSFLMVYFMFPIVPGVILKFGVGLAALALSLYASAWATARIIKPLRPVFKATNQEYQTQVLGQVATVRTGEVTQVFGEAFLEDGGAGLILKVRSYHDQTFKRGDRVVLLEYDRSNNSFKVISESEFKN